MKFCIRALFCVIIKIQNRTKWYPLQNNDTRSNEQVLSRFFKMRRMRGNYFVLIRNEFRPTLY